MRPPRGAARRVEAAGLGRDRGATLAALKMRPSAFARHLGAHRVSVTSTVQTTARGKETIEQKVSLVVDGEGHFHGVKNTHEQYGHELIWTGKWLYSRLRYQPFSRRRPQDAQEPARLADKHVGHLAAYVRLLGPFLAVTRLEREVLRGRDVVFVALARRDKPLARLGEGRIDPSRRWRSTVDVEQLEGKVALDAKTGAPLSVTLKARWTFALPKEASPQTGIPAELSSERGRSELAFGQEITAIGQRLAITAPPTSQLVDVRRRRLEIERQMVTGERPMAPGWRARWGDVERSK